MTLLCDIVQEGIYLKNNVMKEWTDHCHARAHRREYGSSKQKAILMFDQELKRLPVSHLHTYESDETQQMWENKAVDNGLRVRLIEDAFIVFNILKDSSAQKEGFRLGDEIKMVNGRELSFASDVSAFSGAFTINRDGKEQALRVKATELFDDQKPQREVLAPHISRLRLPSFLPQYFDDGAWKKLVGEFKDDKLIVIDLRGNAGGAFPAMLRSLSPFLCRPTNIGYLTTDRDSFKEPDDGVDVPMPNSDETQRQLDALEANSKLRLQTFVDYGCIKADVTALVDADTSSVSEIFAWALRLRPVNLPKPRVWGVPTAGQVVMARWFDLAPLSFSGYQISIPIATFLTPSGVELEGEGVTPQRLLFYDLAKARAGLDSWLEAAISK